jgi:hypothetical protein
MKETAFGIVIGYLTMCHVEPENVLLTPIKVMLFNLECSV